MGHHVSSTVRLLVSVLVGVVTGVGLTFVVAWQVSILAGWMAAAAVFVVWLGITVFPMDAAQTRSHAAREDPNRRLTDLTLVVAAIASLAAVVLVLTGGKQTGGQDVQAALTVTSVVLSWTTVHMLFVTRYAREFYGDDPGCIDFNTTKPPRYLDFAYLAFTIGMTFQVSDTPLKTTTLRAMALRHALVSYLFGVGIIATMINLVAGLGK